MKKQNKSSGNSILTYGIIFTIFFIIVIAILFSEPARDDTPIKKKPNNIENENENEKKIEKKIEENNLNLNVPKTIPIKNNEEIKIYKISGQVPKVEWEQDSHFLEKALKRNYPVIFKNTIVEIWKAKYWTPEYISESLENFTGAYFHNQKLFGPYWDPERPLSQFETIIRKNPHKDINITTKEFVENMKNPKKNEFYYFSGNINKLNKELISDIQPTSFLETEPDSKKQNINFWIGMKGTTAHTHYDVYENFNVQIFGRKKWTLFAPDSPVYLYPFVHPSHAQAQVNVDDPDLKKFPNVKNLVGIEAITEPGEVLYLPPMWLHKVEAIDNCINVNCWSYSENTNFLKKLRDLPSETNPNQN